MTKQETLDFLRAHGVAFELTEHRAVFHMEESAALDLPYPRDDAKNLLIRDDRHENYYLITVRNDKRVDLKQFRRRHGTRPLTFASPQELKALLALTPGSVTPLGLLADREHRVTLFLDRDFLQPPGRIGIHPNDNTATIWLPAQALIDLLRENGAAVEVADFNI